MEYKSKGKGKGKGKGYSHSETGCSHTPSNALHFQESTDAYEKKAGAK